MNEHSEKFELVKGYYNSGLWKKKAVQNAVKKGWITQAEYDEIVNGIVPNEEPVEEEPV